MHPLAVCKKLPGVGLNGPTVQYQGEASHVKICMHNARFATFTHESIALFLKRKVDEL